MRSNQTTTKWLAAASVLAFLAGCGGCYTPAEERHLVLTVTKPQIGQTLTLKDHDTEPPPNGRDGLQYDVEVKLEWEDVNGQRSTADVESAALSLTRPDGTTEDGVAGTVAPGGIATFVGVTFDQEGTWLLKPVARELSSHETSPEVTVSVKIVLGDKVLPKVTSVTIPEDLNGDFKLNAAELSGSNKFTVQYAATDFSAGVAWVANASADGTKHSQDVQLPSNSLVTDLPASSPTEQSYDLLVHLLTPDLLENDLSNSATRNSEAFFTVTVDQIAPTVKLTQPLDRDGGYSTNQLLASATVSGAEGQTVTFTAQLVDGGSAQPAGTAVVTNGVATGQVTLINPGVQTLTATVADPAGNVGTDAVQLWVNTGACPVTLTNPSTTPSYVGPGSDTNSAVAGVQYHVQGSAPLCPNQLARVTVGTTVVTGATDASGNFDIEVTLAPNNNTVKAEVDNGAGVFGNGSADIFLGSADFKLTQPANNATLNIASDLDATQAGIQYVLSYQPAPATGQSVSICINVAPGSTTTPCPDGASGWFQIDQNTAPSVTRFSYPEGTYQMKGVLLTGANVLGVTPVVNLVVDNQRPTISDVKLQNDSDVNKKLNATEQATGDAVLVVTTSGLADGRPVTIKNRTTGAVIATGTVTNNVATITLTGINGPELDYQISIEFSDAAGNANDTTAQNASFDFRVDRVLPTVSFTEPAKANLGPSDDGSTASGYQIHAVGASQADLASMTFQVNAQTPVSGTKAGNNASADLTVASTGTTTYTLTAVAADASGNVGPASTKQVTVDLDPPQVTIITPNTSGSPYGQYTQVTTVSVPNENGLPVKIFSTVQGQTEQLLGTLTVVNGTASGNITYPNGTQTIRAEVTDLAGNVGNGTMQITVNGVGCSIALAAPAPGTQYLNKSNDAVPSSATTLDYDVVGSSSNCSNKPVIIYQGSGGSRTILASGSTNGAGNFTIRIQLPEATASQHIEVELNNGAGVLTFVPADFTVDLTPPTISAVTPSDAALFYVTPQNRRIGVQAGYIADSDPSTANAQGTFTYQVTGANGGKANVFFGGTAAAAQTDVTADPQSVSSSVTLTQATSGQVEVRATDAAGNTASYFTNATVDVVAPAAPTFVPTLTNSRTAIVTTTWASVFDDGTSSTSGAVTGYDVRWSTTTLLPSGVPDETTFFGTKTKQHTGALLPASTTSATLTVPPINTYWISVRAVDDLGNYSAFTPATSLANPWLQQAFTNPGGSTGYGNLAVSNGDLNGDGIADFVIAAPNGTAPGKVYAYYGNSTAASITPQAITPADTSAQNFGIDIAIGNVGDAASENLSDLLVGAGSYNSAAGRVYLYPGRSGTVDAANPIIFSGGAAGARFGNRVAVVNDLNKDGIRDVIIAAPQENSGQGRFYVYFGRSVSAWQALATANGGTIGESQADRWIDGPTPVGTGLAKNGFGQNRGTVGIGDINGDGNNDFAIAASADNVNLVYVVSGLTLVNKTAPSGVPTLSMPTDALQTISGLVPASAGSSSDGPGSVGAGNVSLIGGAGTDLLLSNPVNSRMIVVKDAGSTGFVTASPFVIQGAQLYGKSARVADLNGDGKPDILGGEGLATNSSAWLLFNTGVAGAEFDTTTGTGFNQSQLKSTTALGTSMAIGDFNADGKIDIVIGDTAGSGTVTLWY